MDFMAWSWITIILLKFASCLDPPDRDGCTFKLDLTGCAYNTYCLNTFDMSLDSFRRLDYNNYYKGKINSDTNLDCNEFITIQGYGNYYKMHVVYKDTTGSDGSDLIAKYIPNTFSHRKNDYILLLIERLDLSNNGYHVSPNLQKMNNLKFLKLTYNLLTTAKLSNPTELPALVDIDMSYNTISTIEIDQSENSYMYLQKCNLSNNYLVNIPDAVFYTFTQLLTLDLSHNFIDVLSITSFGGLKKLKQLYLSYNRIFDISYSLFRFSDLEVLDLSYNRIELIKFSNFEKLPNLMTIDLSGNFIKNIENDVFGNMKLLQILKLNRNMLEIIDKNTFKNASKLEVLDISNNHLRTLPTGLFKESSNMLHFDVVGNYLEGSILKGTFEGLQRVDILDLSDQRITVIEDYAFLGLQKITNLNLEKNKIQTLAKNCFKTMLNLNTLDLSDNIIADINFDVEDLVNLVSLSFRGNYLTKIKVEHFKGLTLLQFLDLSNNKITNLESYSFTSLSGLINLDISNNPLSGILKENTFLGLHSIPRLDILCTELTTIENNSFTGMVHLEKFNGSHGNISELQYNSFNSTGLIETIDLSFNQLRTFGVNATDLKHLKVLLLHRNLLKYLSEMSFLGLESLTIINLAHNNIKSMNEHAFKNQKYLSCLDISFNIDVDFRASIIHHNRNLSSLFLSGIKSEVRFNFTGINENELSILNISFSGIANITNLDLRKLERLESLILSNNNITKLESGALANVKALHFLDLSFNKITYIQPGVFKDNRNLVILNISHNSLSTVSYGIFRGLSNLNTLNLSFNNINTLENERFYEVQSLNTLIVDHNDISFVNIGEFRGTSLTELSIGENPIPCEILVKLKKQHAPFRLTAINIDEKNTENVDGITCNNRGFKRMDTHNDNIILNNNENILTNIRDTLHKIANTNFTYLKNNKSDDSQYFLNITQEIIKLRNDYDMKATSMMNTSKSILSTSKMSLNTSKMTLNESATTNILLEKILQSLSRVNLMTPPLSGTNDNATKLNDVVQYIDNVKHDLQELLYSEKKNILDRKLSATTFEVMITSTPIPSHEKLLASDKNVIESAPSLFTDTCVALILLILVCFILYKFYKSRMSVRASRSYSTRELPGAMESQDL